MFQLLGIDDTGRPGSPETSSLALTLGQHLESTGLARLVNISCHQLLQSAEIACTSHNIACCLLLDADDLRFREIDLASRSFLRSACSVDSNPGFALAAWNAYHPEIMAWGVRAKVEKLERPEALQLGRQYGISIAGFTGSGNGVIGALAAVGLRFRENDGWLSWMPGLSALLGFYNIVELAQVIHFDSVVSLRGRKPGLEDRILIQSPVKPALRNGKTVLLLKPAKRGAEHQWETVDESAV